MNGFIDWLGQRIWQSVLTLVALAIALFVIAKITSVAAKNTPHTELGNRVVYIEDMSAVLGIEDVLSIDETRWMRDISDDMSWGIHHSPVWLKTTIPQLDERHEWLLEIDNIMLDELDIWFLYDGSRVDYHAAGDDIPLAGRQSEHAKFIFPIPQFKESPITLIIRAKTGGTLKLPVYIWQEADYWVFHGEHNLVVGLFLGLLIAIGLSNFFFFITTGSTSFLYYFSFVIAVTLTLATIYGVGYEYFWPTTSWLQAKGIAIFANLSVFFAAFFGRSTFEVDKVSPSLEKTLLVFAYAFLTMSVVSFFVVYLVMIKIFLVMMSLFVAFCLFLGTWLWFNGKPIARVYVMAWSLALLFGLLTAMGGFSVSGISPDFRYSPLLITVVESIIFALILAFEHRRKQAELQETLSEAQEDLSYKVEERTLELQIALRELSETNNELEKKNSLDALTGIKNRRYFDKKYVAEVRRSRREQTILSVAMVDIDHFKSINDNYGHLVGDACIQHAANVIQNELKRPSDEVCRYGGEEFSIILPNTDREGATGLLEDIRRSLENSVVEVEEHEIRMTLSGGIATAESQWQGDESKLIAVADRALYESKQKGRNQVIHHYLSEED